MFDLKDLQDINELIVTMSAWETNEFNTSVNEDLSKWVDDFEPIEHDSIDNHLYDEIPQYEPIQDNPQIEPIKTDVAQPRDSEDSPKIRDTKLNEGFRSKVYNDTLGYKTIGYGHKLTKDEIKTNKFANGLSKDEALKLYEQDTKREYALIYKTAPWLKKQPQTVQEVIKDMAFNMGGSFIKHWPILQRQLKQGEYKAAAKNILSTRYAKQVKGRAIRNAQAIASVS